MTSFTPLTPYPLPLQTTRIPLSPHAASGIHRHPSPRPTGSSSFTSSSSIPRYAQRGYTSPFLEKLSGLSTNRSKSKAVEEQEDQEEDESEEEAEEKDRVQSILIPEDWIKTDKEGGLASLSWTSSSVVFNHPDFPSRTYSFHQSHPNQSVIQPLLCNFLLPSTPSTSTSPTPSTSTSTSSSSATSSFGPFHPLPPQPWSDAPLPLPIAPSTSTCTPPLLTPQPHLLIFLSDSAFAYPLSQIGGITPFSLPFKLRRAFPVAPGSTSIGVGRGGVILQSTTGEWWELNERGVKEGCKSFGMLDNYKGDLSWTDGDWAVSTNKEGVRVWKRRVATGGEKEEEKEDKKGKGKSKEVISSSTTTTTTTTKLAGSKRKRTSTSAPSSSSLPPPTPSTSTSFLPPPPTPSLTLETLLSSNPTSSASTSMARTASQLSASAAMVDRRGSVTRNELSLTMDRMALGNLLAGGNGGAGGGMEEVGEEEEEKEEELEWAEVWKGRVDSSSHSSLSIHHFDIITTSPGTTSTLALHSSPTSTLLLLSLSSTSTSTTVNPLKTIRASLVTPVLATRKKEGITDLLVWTSPPDKEGEEEDDDDEDKTILFDEEYEEEDLKISGTFSLLTSSALELPLSPSSNPSLSLLSKSLPKLGFLKSLQSNSSNSILLTFSKTSSEDSFRSGSGIGGGSGRRRFGSSGAGESDNRRFLTSLVRTGTGSGEGEEEELEELMLRVLSMVLDKEEFVGVIREVRKGSGGVQGVREVLERGFGCVRSTSGGKEGEEEEVDDWNEFVRETKEEVEADWLMSTFLPPPSTSTNPSTNTHTPPIKRSTLSFTTSPPPPFSEPLRTAIVLALHLLMEDCYLRTKTEKWVLKVGEVLVPLVASLGWKSWLEGLRRKGVVMDLETIISPVHPPILLSTTSPIATNPPSILRTLSALLTSSITSSEIKFFSLSSIRSSLSLTTPSSSYYGPIIPLSTTKNLIKIYRRLAEGFTDSSGSSGGTTSGGKKAPQATVQELLKVGWGKKEIGELGVGVRAPIREAVRWCQIEVVEEWEEKEYTLVGREDLSRMSSGSTLGGGGREGKKVRRGIGGGNRKPWTIDDICVFGSAGISIENIPPPQVLPDGAPQPKATRFNEDRRLEEVGRMLQFSEPVTVSAGDRTIDQLTPSVQQNILTSLSNRTLALPIGFAMFHYHQRSPSSLDAVLIPRVNTSARILPMPSPVALVDKDRDSSNSLTSTAAERLEWPEFHAGVSAALRIRRERDGENEFDSSQISFNKPGELDAKHAGFLMGLGLTGRIEKMMFNQAFEYLKAKHDPTSIGLLLGLAVTFIGTGDAKVTSLLSVHLAALHPPNSSTLNVSGITQAASLVGIGLLHLGSKKRTLADIMVRELCEIKVINVEDPASCREAYGLSAGFAFGFIMLGKGSDPLALTGEVTLLRTFRALILGESNHPLPGAAPSSNITDVNITSSAATIAISLMYLRTEREDVAAILEIPDTPRRLDYVRSDLLLLRTLGRALIMWEGVTASKPWVESHIPSFISEALNGNGAVGGGTGSSKAMDSDLDIARWNVVAGACFAIGLKFAGTAAAEAHSTLIHYLDRLTRAAYVKAATLQGKIKRHAIRSCLSVIAVSLSMVMAGTGEINVLRRLRVAHGHFSEGVTYGTHLASHMALGLLFVGAGHYTLGTSDTAIASLLLAFYPSFPPTSSENRAHLQAYRHLWTLAVEPRCLEVRDVDTNEPTFLPIRLRLLERGNVPRAKQLVAPTLIPEIRYIESIQVDSPRYWAFTLHLTSNPNHLANFLREGTIYVKRRTGHLSYAQDPRGIRSIFTRSKSETGSSVFDFGETARMLAPSAAGLRDFVSAFTDDGEAIAAVTYLCHPDGSQCPPTAFEAFNASVLLECLTRDKRDTVPIYFAMHLANALVHRPTLTAQALVALEQQHFILEYYSQGIHKALFSRSKPKSSAAREPLIQPALVAHTQRKVYDRADELMKSPKVSVALQEYLATSTWPTDPVLVFALAMWLRLQGAPELEMMEQLREVVRSSVQDPKLDAGARKALELLIHGTGKAVEERGGIAWSRKYSLAATEAWLR